MNSLVSFFPLFLNPFSKVLAGVRTQGQAPSSLLGGLAKLVV